VDIAENQILAARKRAVELKLDKACAFQVATAEETKQSDKSFDLIVASQAWPWFKHKECFVEMRRLLKPNGFIVICQYCYLPQRSTLARDSEALVLKLNPKWTLAGFDGLYPSQVDQLVVSGGFEFCEQFCFDHPQTFTHESWRGRMRTCNGVGSGTLGDDLVRKYDQELADLLKQKYPKNEQEVWHRVWAVIVSTDAGAKL